MARKKIVKLKVPKNRNRVATIVKASERTHPGLIGLKKYQKKR